MTYYTSLRSASVEAVAGAEPRGRSPGCHWAEYRLKTALLLVAVLLVLLVWRMTPQGSHQGISRSNRTGTGAAVRRNIDYTLGSSTTEDASSDSPTSLASLDYFGRAELAHEQPEHYQLTRPHHQLANNSNGRSSVDQ